MDSDPDLVATYVLQSVGDTDLAVFPAERGSAASEAESR